MRYYLLYCQLKANNSENLTAASKHLRYWPYVKSYVIVDSQTLDIMIYVCPIGTDSKRDYYFQRARELLLLCLRQYGITLTIGYQVEGCCIPQYSDELFLRPDSLLKPFSDFIDEMDGGS